MRPLIIELLSPEDRTLFDAVTLKLSSSPCRQHAIPPDTNLHFYGDERISDISVSDQIR